MVVGGRVRNWFKGWLSHPLSLLTQRPFQWQTSIAQTGFWPVHLMGSVPLTPNTPIPSFSRTLYYKRDRCLFMETQVIQTKPIQKRGYLEVLQGPTPARSIGRRVWSREKRSTPRGPARGAAELGSGGEVGAGGGGDLGVARRRGGGGGLLAKGSGKEWGGRGGVGGWGGDWGGGGEGVCVCVCAQIGEAELRCKAVKLSKLFHELCLRSCGGPNISVSFPLGCTFCI